MKIEFKKQTDLDGTYYFTEVDGNRVIGSTKISIDEGYKFFLLVVENEGQTIKIETLETKEI